MWPLSIEVTSNEGDLVGLQLHGGVQPLDELQREYIQAKDQGYGKPILVYNLLLLH